MSLVVMDDVSLDLGGKPILSEVTLRLAEGERIGLVGPNGAGKSTFLRLLADEQVPDGGAVRRQRNRRVGYLPQDVPSASGRTVLAAVLEGVPGRALLEEQLEHAHAELGELEERTANAGPDEAVHEAMAEVGGRIAELHDRLAHFDAEYSPHRAKQILSGLGFGEEDMDRDLGELSGGWRMRVVLAGLLFQRPDLLLLDEPTNHLDMPSVAWFSGFLRRYRGAFVLVSHDREFLNEQITRVISFEPEGLRTYNGDYEAYRQQRDEERVVLAARAKNLEREREQAERFIARFRAKATKAAQVQSRVRALERMETVELQAQRDTMSFRFPAFERSGKEPITGTGISKRFGERQVLDGVDLRVGRGDRIAIIGANGAGKTTLLRVLAGELEASGGQVQLGHKVKLGYYAQHHTEVLPLDATAYEVVAAASTDGNRTAIRAALGALLMGEDDVDKRIRVLSGGERARVALARLLVDPGNVLLMDEPTNHLDLDSSEALAEALQTFEGTLVFVSHNRRFVRALATQIWDIEQGKLRVYPGTLDDYMRSAQSRLDEDCADRQSGVAPAPSDDAAGAPRNRAQDRDRKRREAEARARRKRLLGPLETQVNSLEEQIAALEEAQGRIADDLSDPTLYEDPERRDAALREQKRIAQELEDRTAQWMEAQERLEEVERDLSSEDPVR